MFLRAGSAASVKAVISIHGAREFGVEAPAGIHRLDLEFDDFEEGEPGDEVAFYRAHAQRKWAAETGRPVAAPTLNHARAIVEFARKTRDLDGIVLCHCGAGMSRAPSAALLCLATWTEPGHEAECVVELMKLRPGATPLVGLVRLGDEMLDRAGRLIRAVTERRRA